MDQETIKELFVAQIRDLYDAEKQIVRALPKLAKAADSEDLSQALTSHLEETKNHVSRLEKVFQLIGSNAKGKPCKGMKGLLEEGSEAVEEEDAGQLRDLAIIAGCQKVEHYEMSAYGTVRTLAEQMEKEDIVELLQETEDEEKEADEKLTALATEIYEMEGGEEADEAEEEPAVNTRSARPATRKAGR